MRSIITTLSILLLYSGAAVGKTALDYLRETPPPVFKQGNTLDPLTRWAWTLSYELNVELAQRWGYALDIDPGRTGEHLDDPNSLASRTVAFNKANQNRYPVSVTTRRVMFEWDTLPTLLSTQAWLRDSSGAPVLKHSRPVLKPYVSDADAAAMGQAEIARLQRLKNLGVNVAVILNGAEYMPDVPGNDGSLWRMDPEVNAWLNSLSSLSPAARVDAFASGKTKQEQSVRDAALSVMPQSKVVYYVTGDVRRGLVSEESRATWAYPYRLMKRGGTVPSWQFYFPGDGPWAPTGSSQDSIPLLATNGVAQAIEDGRPLTYNWLTAGWSLTDPSAVSDDEHYLGFLKFLYTLGSSGNVAGYFSFPPNGFNGDVGTSQPDWLRQIMLLSHAHATFTHLEHFLRDGDLLPGDGNHAYSVDLYNRASWPHPAYEFVTNEGNRSSRVAARKLRDKNEWLLVAWAASGPDRQISVTIPSLGKTTMLARAEGSLYLAKPGQAPKLLDPSGMDPSRRIAELLEHVSKPSPPLDFSVN